MQAITKSHNLRIDTKKVLGATLGSIFFAGSGGAIKQDNSNLFWDDTNNFLGIGIAVPTARLHIVQAAATSGTPKAFLLTGGAHTTLTASTEAISADFNFAQTIQFATGAITLQRTIFMRGATYSFVGASTVTTAVTLYVDPPTAGTNATFSEVAAIYSHGKLIVENTASAKQIILLGAVGGISQIATEAAAALQFVDGLAGASSAISCIFRSGNVRTAGTLFVIQNATTGVVAITYYGGFDQASIATGSGTAFAMRFTGANHTSQTASTEINNYSFGAYTRTWAAGAITTQREWRLYQPTYAFASASTITTAANLYIAGAPIAGTNATITKSLALWVDADDARFDGNLLLGATAAGASAAGGVLAMGNGAVAPSDSTDLAQIYAVDLSPGNCTLGIRVETAVVTESVVSDRTLSVVINGTTYKICLKV